MADNAVVVGVDGSEIATGALDWAAGLAKELDAELRIVCAYRLPSYAGRDGTDRDETTVREGAQAVVEEAAARVAPLGLEVAELVDPGDPSGVLIEMSRSARVVVTGTRGGGGFADRLLGAVPSAVPAHAHCTAVVVPEPKDGRTFMPPRKIAVGVDGSESSRGALLSAVRMATLFGAELFAVAAVPITTGAGAMAWLPSSMDQGQILRDIENSMDEVLRPALEGTSVTVTRSAIDGNPAGTLTEFSDRVDLVVVGTRGRGGFRGLLMGSTSQTVLGHSSCPVMVTPSRAESSIGD